MKEAGFPILIPVFDLYIYIASGTQYAWSF